MTRARNIAGFSTITTTPSPIHVGPIGVLTATRIDGEFNVVDIASRDITAQGIGVTNLQISGITTGLNVSGIITAQNGINFNGTSTGLNVSGVATFANNVNIGGVLTYEDVTNIDSIGIITARKGIVSSGVVTATSFSGSGVNLTNLNASNIASGTVPTARLGSGTANNTTFLRGDSTFQTVNTDLVSDTSPQLGGDLDTNSNLIKFPDSNGTTNRLMFGTNKFQALYDSGNSRMSLDNLTGSFLIRNSASGQDIDIIAANDIRIRPQAGESGINVVGDGAVELYYDNSKKFETGTNGIIVTGQIYGNSGMIVGAAGGDSALELYSDAGGQDADKVRIRQTHVGNSFLIESYASGAYQSILKGTDARTIELHYQGSKKLETTSAGVEITGSGTNAVEINGSGGHELYSYHDSGGAGWATGTSTNYGELLYLDENNSQVYLYAAGEIGLRVIGNGAAELYHNNIKKFETTSDGVLITSNGSSNGLFINHSNGNEVAQLTHGGSGDEGVLVLRDSGNSNIIFRGETGQNCHISGPNALHFGNTTGAGTGTRGVSISAVTSGNPVFIQSSSMHYTSGNYSHWYIYDDHGMVGRVTANGDGTTSFVTSSDYRLKENVVPIADGITKLKTLKPYRFNYKTADTSKVVQGFFAHEVSEACPNAVNGTKDEMKSIYYEEGDTIPSGKAVGDFKEFSTTEINPQGLDVSKLVPLLTAALQEAVAKIETLEVQVRALQGG